MILLMEEILHQLRLVVYPFLPWFTRVFSCLHPNGAWPWDFFHHRQYDALLIRVHHSAEEKRRLGTPDQQKGASSIHHATEELSTSMCFMTNQVSTFNYWVKQLVVFFKWFRPFFQEFWSPLFETKMPSQFAVNFYRGKGRGYESHLGRSAFF